MILRRAKLTDNFIKPYQDFCRSVTTKLFNIINQKSNLLI